MARPGNSASHQAVSKYWWPRSANSRAAARKFLAAHRGPILVRLLPISPRDALRSQAGLKLVYEA